MGVEVGEDGVAKACVDCCGVVVGVGFTETGAGSDDPVDGVASGEDSGEADDDDGGKEMIRGVYVELDAAGVAVVVDEAEVDS